MITDLKRLYDLIKMKIFLLIGRGIVTSIDNSKKTQSIQISGMANETISDVERVQEYGLETYPFTMRFNTTTKKWEGSDSSNLSEAEAVTIFQNGDRGRGLIVCIGDRNYRLTDLAQGEVAIYTFKDKDAGNHRVHLKNDRTIEIKASSVTINCSVTVTSGDISDSKGTAQTMDAMRSTFNNHKHTGVETGGGTSGNPNSTM